MSFTLKSTGIATNLVACLMVDDDNTTIKEFKGNTDGVVNGAVTVGTSTWKGVSRKYFETLADGTFNYFGITWTSSNGPQTAFNDSDGAAVFCAFAGSSAGSGGPNPNWLTFSGGEGEALMVNGSGKAVFTFGGSAAVSTTTIPTDGTTKFSVGGNWKSGEDPTHSQIFYGAESGSLSSEAEATPGNFGGVRRLTEVGGAAGNGSRPAKYHIIALFNRELTTGEMQSLHNDWFGTLFESAAAPTITDFGDESHRVGEVGVTITGTGFGASQGTGLVKISPTDNVNDVNAVTQTVSGTWTDTSIPITIVRGPSAPLPVFTNVYLFVKNDAGSSNAAGYVCQLTTPVAALIAAIRNNE